MSGVITSGLPNLPRILPPNTTPIIPEQRPYNRPFVTTVAYAASITPNVDTTDLLVIGTLTGNISIANPAGTPADGQTLVIRFKQDGTGGRTYTMGSSYSFGTLYTLASWPTTANAYVQAEFRYNATSSKWAHTNRADV